MISCINNPFVKQGVKNFASAVTFSSCILAPIKKSETRDTVYKVILVIAKVSLILSACTTYPGSYIVATLTGFVATPAELETIFGKNTIFAINPWHPRHVVSIAAATVSLVPLLYFLFKKRRRRSIYAVRYVLISLPVDPFCTWPIP